MGQYNWKMLVHLPPKRIRGVEGGGGNVREK